MSGSIEKLIEAIEANTAVMQKLLEESDSPALPEGGKRNSKSAEDEPAPKKKETAKKETAKKETAEEKPKAKRATKKLVGEKLKEYAAEFGKEQTFEMLAEFNVEHPKDLNSAQYGKVVKTIDDHLANGLPEVEEVEEEEIDDDFDL